LNEGVNVAAALRVRADARFSALCGLGFREGEVQRALRALCERADLANGSARDWLRAALQRLTPARR
jgi:Holliday junction resolvasome RuvABC DNA-binding subunit